MLNVSEIAIFLLATVSFNGPNYQIQKLPSYFESRIVPIKQTWGSFFPLLYFVFGNNYNNYRFLTDRCRHHSSFGEGYTLQRFRNSTDLFECPIPSSASKWNRSKYINSPDPPVFIQMYNSYQTGRLAPLRALYTANCTGNYFGLGPTCRCQEAMRFFISQSMFAHVNWFAFMDDDLYYRPFSLLAMLHEMDSMHAYSLAPAALLATGTRRGFRDFKNKLSKNGAHNCTNASVYSFAFAQPAFLNRRAIDHLSSAVHSSALTRLHRLWGGSHDGLLGMVLWAYRVPVYSLDRFYWGSPLYVRRWRANNETALVLLSPPGSSNYTIFHRVMSRVMYQKGPGGALLPVHEIASQYDIAEYLGEALLYNNEEISETKLKRFFQEQVRIGRRNAHRIMYQQQNTVNLTIFAEKAERIVDKYQDFTPSDCKIL